LNGEPTDHQELESRMLVMLIGIFPDSLYTLISVHQKDGSYLHPAPGVRRYRGLKKSQVSTAVSTDRRILQHQTKAHAEQPMADKAKHSCALTGGETSTTSSTKQSCICQAHMEQHLFIKTNRWDGLQLKKNPPEVAQKIW
jgi:hypothetical protein